MATNWKPNTGPNPARRDAQGRNQYHESPGPQQSPLLQVPGPKRKLAVLVWAEPQSSHQGLKLCLSAMHVEPSPLPASPSLYSHRVTGDISTGSPRAFPISKLDAKSENPAHTMAGIWEAYSHDDQSWPHSYIYIEFMLINPGTWISLCTSLAIQFWKR